MQQDMIGKRLKMVRLYREQSRAELAAGTGFAYGVISNTERGTRDMAFHEAVVYGGVLCFCLTAFGRTEPDGRWDMMACLLPYTPPANQPKKEAEEEDPL